MSTYTQILYQIVFGSKSYTPFLTTNNQNILFAYIAGILKKKSCHSYIVGGASNHIHIVTHIHPILSLSNVVKDIKEASHAMMCKEGSLFIGFPGWQVGYGVFTYHIKSKQSLIDYVVNQPIHHKTLSYKDELTKLLNDNNIEYKDEYLLI